MQTTRRRVLQNRIPRVMLMVVIPWKTSNVPRPILLWIVVLRWRFEEEHKNSVSVVIIIMSIIYLPTPVGGPCGRVCDRRLAIIMDGGTRGSHNFTWKSFLTHVRFNRQVRMSGQAGECTGVRGRLIFNHCEIRLEFVVHCYIDYHIAYSYLGQPPPNLTR